MPAPATHGGLLCAARRHAAPPPPARVCSARQERLLVYGRVHFVQVRRRGGGGVIACAPWQRSGGACQVACHLVLRHAATLTHRLRSRGRRAAGAGGTQAPTLIVLLPAAVHRGTVQRSANPGTRLSNVRGTVEQGARLIPVRTALAAPAGPVGRPPGCVCIAANAVAAELPPMHPHPHLQPPPPYRVAHLPACRYTAPLGLSLGSGCASL